MSPARNWTRFILTLAFDREWSSLGLGDEDLRLLQKAIADAPTRSPVVRGAGGMRKIRFAGAKSGRGKSGADRIGYAFFPEHHAVALLSAWGKTQKADLSRVDQVAAAVMIRDLKGMLDRGEI
jgi:hypothetical protein